MAKKKKDQKKSGGSVDFPVKIQHITYKLTFQKAKKKLGKKSQQSNLTNISFKTKGLYIPTQSILEDKHDKITTTRKQTLESLLTQVKHYNYNVRKEALLGICELVEKHSSLLTNYLGNILHTTVELIVDEENAVRSNLRKLNSLILENSVVTEVILIHTYMHAHNTYVDFNYTFFELYYGVYR
jgi:pre-rRNA-processing protein IPI1